MTVSERRQIIQSIMEFRFYVHYRGRGHYWSYSTVTLQARYTAAIVAQMPWRWPTTFWLDLNLTPQDEIYFMVLCFVCLFVFGIVFCCCFWGFFLMVVFNGPQNPYLAKSSTLRKNSTTILLNGPKFLPLYLNICSFSTLIKLLFGEDGN